ncbi:uncharacterized protein [Aristolochia californica]|uniref:uncharacterized protein n=1 Tax=Aristolochia californica TaxID=171875 RepID=UPI0035E12505
MGATMKNLEVQIGQLAMTINAQQRGAFPSNTEVNPKKQCKAIQLRSGREIETFPSKESKSTPTVANNGQNKNKVEEGEIVNDTLRETDVPLAISFPNNPPILSTPFLYRQRFQKQKLDKRFSKFLDIFKKIHINIPFADALEQMSNYIKSLKDIISKKRRLEDFETVKLSEECSAILQKKLPQKLKDPRSFTLPCTIGNSFFDKVLCDLGASINLMPFFVCRKLGLGEMKQTTISLQLADQSIKYPHGIIEDVLVKVDKFIFPADFVVLDMEKDEEVPLILGRPFLATGRALIDVQKVTSLSNEMGRLEPMVAKIDYVNSKEKMQQTTTPKLKQLPEHLHYAFLGDGYTFPVIVVASLTPEEEEKLLRVLREHRTALGWIISDIKGISPSICMHKILMEELYKPTIKHQRRLNPVVKEVVRAEILKLLIVGIIYAISYSSWRCEDKNLVLNWEKSHFVVQEGIVLDHRVSSKGIEVIEFTDHAALHYLFGKKDAKPRLIRWILLLQEFELEVQDTKGSKNSVADHLSRLEQDEERSDLVIQEAFPDEQLFCM